MASKYHCNYCDEDIKEVRVKCGECPDFDLCLKCFSSGAEIGKHKNKHKYQLIDCGTFSIFDSQLKWKAIEEMALLEAVELYGFGNWNDVAAFVGTHSPEEVKEHFCSYYVYGNIGKHTWDVLRNTTLEIKDHTAGDDDRPMSPFLSTSLSNFKPDLSNIEPFQQQQLGYMPKRDDFEREFDNDAENVISYLTISQEDDEIDKELKAIHVHVYKQRLNERFRRKTIAREYNLVNSFFNKEDENKEEEENFSLISTIGKKNKQNNSPQKDGQKLELDLELMSDKEKIERKMRLLSQYQSQEEQKLLIDNLHRECELRQRLKELIKIRKQNLKKLNNDGKEAVKSPKKKETIKKSKMNSMDTGCVQKSTYSPNSKKEKSNINQTPVKIKEEFLIKNDQMVDKNGDLEQEFDFEKSISNYDDLNSSIKNTKDKFDVYSMPTTRLLSDQEKKFCNTIKLRPSQYLNLKTLILKEHVQKKNKNSTSNGKSILETVDKVTHKKMVNFMTKCGWISN